MVGFGLTNILLVIVIKKLTIRQLKLINWDQAYTYHKLL